MTHHRHRAVVAALALPAPCAGDTAASSTADTSDAATAIGSRSTHADTSTSARTP